MNEKTKNILSYALSILIVGGIITCLVIYPRITLTWFFDIVLAVSGLLILCFVVVCLKGLLYDFLAAIILRRYIANTYPSIMNRRDSYSVREETKYVQGVIKTALSSIHYEHMVDMMSAVLRERTYLSKRTD